MWPGPKPKGHENWLAEWRARVEEGLELGVLIESEVTDMTFSEGNGGGLALCGSLEYFIEDEGMREASFGAKGIRKGKSRSGKVWMVVREWMRYQRRHRLI